MLRRFAAEAWRRADAGELTDNELYCDQAGKTRLRRERAGFQTGPGARLCEPQHFRME